MKQLLCKKAGAPLKNASEALQSLWEQADHKVYFTCLSKPSEAVYEVLEQMADPSEYSEILTDDPQIYRQLSEGDHPLLKQSPFGSTMIQRSLTPAVFSGARHGGSTGYESLVKMRRVSRHRAYGRP